ncbi:MAG: extracellular solute-binding protein [Ignavibacteria bacterium]|nr:extracellular solute-binding protein [Ignavibacteria bacterium]
MKTISSLFFLSIILVFLASCSKEEKKISFWHFWSEPAQSKVIRELVQKFEKEKNCKVEITELSWGEGKTKLIAAFNSKTAPDVLELGSDWIAQFSYANVLEKLDPEEFNFKKFFEYVNNQAKIDTNYFAVPWILGTRVLFCNMDLINKAGFQQPPENIEELIEISRKINDLNIGYGFGANGSDPHRLYKKILPLIWSYGGELVDSNRKIILHSGPAAQAFDTYFRLSRFGIIETQKQIDLLFVRGKIGFCFSGEWLIEMIAKTNPNLNYKVSLVPKTNQNRGISFAGAEYLAINADSKEKEIAKELIKFFLRKETLLELCKKIPTAGFPADTTLLSDTRIINTEAKKVFSEQLKYSKMTPVHPRWLEIESIIENAVVEVIFQKKGVQQALQDAQKEIDKFNFNITF